MADESDIETIFTYDEHIRKDELETIVPLERVIIAEDKGIFIGWLQWGLFLLSNYICR